MQAAAGGGNEVRNGDTVTITGDINGGSIGTSTPVMTITSNGGDVTLSTNTLNPGSAVLSLQDDNSVSLGYVNSLGNMHGLTITETSAILSGGTTSTSIALTDPGITIRNDATSLNHAVSNTAGQSSWGYNAQAVGVNASAFGAGAAASGNNSVAIGNTASATAANSVALGNGSVANQANTVSVGSAGAERRITNVAAGVDPTDAVNVRQLNNRINEVKTHADSAAAAAMAVPTPDIPAGKNLAMGVQTAEFNGNYAVGIAAALRLGKSAAANIGAATSGAGTGVRAGLQFAW
ncbi:MAG: hypothetical protein CVV37_01860 [Nitrospira bacterium HGW-Nitrospira-1]|nr:MAG: hypothetical protein CVV37_01860 [Nitrospira bacterium HGW-Nitrospira-1]